MKVLLAEDDELTRQGLAEVLASEGYQVAQAANGAAAIEQFAASVPDFVCLDIMMPGRSGYDVCRSIRTTHPDIPIIFISAKSEEIDKIVGFELGADDFIVKPFGVREVAARIRAVTRRCHVARGADPTVSFTMDDLVMTDPLGNPDVHLHVKITVEKGDKKEEITAPVCLVAIGVKPVLPGGVELKLDAKGWIQTDAHYQTSVRGVYAAGTQFEYFCLDCIVLEAWCRAP